MAGPAHFIAICLLTLSTTLCTGTETAPIPTGEKGLLDPVPQGDFEVLAIPLIRVQNLFLIEVGIDSLRGNFILDTGAPNLVLNKTYFSKGALQSQTPQYGITGTGTTVMSTQVDTLRMGELFYTQVNADIVSLGHLEDARGIRILGLLGASFFNTLEMVLDMQQKVLYLYKLDASGNRLARDSTQVPDLETDLFIYNDILFMDGKIADKKLRFCLDTGAERSVLSNAVNNKVLSHFSLSGNGGLLGSSAGKALVLHGTVDSLFIGDDGFGHLPFMLTNLQNLATVYETNLQGVLGYDFFAAGIVSINVKKKKLSMYFYKPETDDE